MTVSEQNMRPLKICLELLLSDLKVYETSKPIWKGCIVIVIALDNQFVESMFRRFCSIFVPCQKFLFHF